MHRPASPQAIDAAIAAYNAVWDAAKDVDARTAPTIRRAAMTAALNAAVPYIDPFIDGAMRQRAEAEAEARANNPHAYE